MRDCGRCWSSNFGTGLFWMTPCPRPPWLVPARSRNVRPSRQHHIDGVSTRMNRPASSSGSVSRLTAKILEIGPFPPPRAGWAVRIEYVKERIERMGHTCSVLNIGVNRKIPSDRYITVRNGLDYVIKVVWYTIRGWVTTHLRFLRIAG